MKIIDILSAISLIAMIGSASAAEIKCPSGNQAKTVNLVKAIQNPAEPRVWYFISSDFSQDGKQWNTWYGVILKDVQTPEEALVEGKEHFSLARIVIANPEPEDIGDGISVCNYVPLFSSYPYFITSINPPMHQVPNKMLGLMK